MNQPKKPRRKPKTPRKSAPVQALSPRIARRERRRERSREEIVQAARRVILQRGLAGTTLEAVAKEVGLTKAALYYYYPSKDSLFHEIMYDVVSAQAQAVHAAVAKATSDGDALGAIVRETVHTFASRLDDFRLTFLLTQLSPGAVTVGAEQLAKLRPLNELAFAGASKLVADDLKGRRGRARVEPRMLAFMASLAALGLLTMKGMVESFGDPLRYSDEELVEGFARIFAAAALPAE